jgi:iron complex outermembrane receptor protein
LDGQISPLRWLSIGGSLNYTDAKFTDGNIGGLLFATYPDTPKWSGAVYADVTVPVRGDVNAFLHGDYFAQTFTWATTNANVNQGARYPGYGIASFRVGLEDQKAGWSLTANVKNAFKKVYYAGGSTLGLLLNFNTVVPGDPRTFSVEVRYKF